jgi:uncharacterized protein (DUF302 family)
VTVRSLDKVVDRPMDQVEQAVREALAGQGFGVLTEIDVAATFKAKLGIDGPALKILGACNPTLAHQALQVDPSAALLLPCNVVLRADGARTEISIADPRTLMPGRELAELAADAVVRLTAALDAV